VGASALATFALFDTDELALLHVKLFVAGKNPLVESALAQSVGAGAALSLLLLEFG
jgi:hypothetical protein